MLPKEFYEYRNNHSSLNLLDGYLTLLSDREILNYSLIANEAISIENNFDVFATTPFGDILIWDGSYVFLLRLAESRIDVILSGFEFFFDNIYDSDYQSDMFDVERFNFVKEKIGNIEKEECYIYEPLPTLGGDMSVDSVKIGNRAEYICFLLSMQK